MIHPWWLLLVQWSTLVGLTTFAFVNAATDHGISMAFNCFCLGFLFFSTLMRPLIERRMESADALLADLKAAEAAAIAWAEKFEQAIKDGYIEVIPMTPDDDQERPTRH
jgi:hypothetical protein